MTKYIFDEIIETKDIYLIIEKNAKNEGEKAHLVTVVKDIIHHKVVDKVLSELDEEKSVIFIQSLDDENQHKGILSKLSTWIVDFEKKVVAIVKVAEKELIEMLNA